MTMHIDRRTFVLGAVGAGAAVTAASLFPRREAAAQARLHRIDVHHHFVPPDYLQELTGSVALNPVLKTWSVQKDIESLDAGAVGRAIISITTPGLWFGLHSASRRLARMCNDYSAKLVSDHPKRFGMYVNVSLPDVEGTLKEIEYGMDTLKAAGVAVFTSYGDKWLGDPAFEPVYAELNRRKAVMYTHPPDPSCCMNMLQTNAFNESMIEYGTDTTRALAKWIVSGMARKYPDIKVIWSHGGGTMPFLVARMINMGRNPRNKELMPDGFLAEAQKFWYDTANIYNKAPLSALKEVVPVSKIVFGTDVPYGTPKRTADEIVAAGVFTPAELARIDRDNALDLMPQYRG